MKPHEFWQGFVARDEPPPYQDRYPAALPDGRILELPIRALPDGSGGIASLILTQASFEVEAALADILAARIGRDRPDIVVGMPTLGLALARAVAARLGHRRYVALGTSRKFWYDADLSVPLSSITSPDATKRLYLDPRMLPLLNGRVALIDDVISTGRSICAGLDLLEKAGVTPVALGAAMLQTRRWRDALAGQGIDLVPHHALSTPRLSRGSGGWHPDETGSDAPPL
ncbi:MAG: phosphoribosyltransferase [Pseudomonadota bacterium]